MRNREIPRGISLLLIFKKRSLWNITNQREAHGISEWVIFFCWNHEAEIKIEYIIANTCTNREEFSIAD
jgi:hypothetical protein